MKELLEILDAIDRFHAQGEPMALATIVGSAARRIAGKARGSC